MALVDQKTPRLGLLLPFTDNFLQDDVERLRDTLNLLDVLVVTRDQTTGKIADDMLSDVIAKLDANGKLNKANLPSTVVQTGPDGKIDGSLMPSIAVIDTFPVPNEASMLGLQCERGDIAIREDLGKTFILTQMPPSVLSNWRELTSTNVTSVNGKTGAVTGLAASGANNDITSLNALSGPLRLGGDGAGDYDAVTLRQLRAASGGSGGASMNGVMNNFIGAVEWFNGSRAKIPAGYIAADGQECSQTDPATADLYAAVSAGLFATVTEALWQNSGNADTLRKGENRGKYVAQSSTGKFRVPDLNGATTDGATPGANFLRGDGGGRFTAEIGDVGAIKYNAAPNITASTSSSVLLGSSTAGQVGGGAFTPKNSVVGAGKATTTGDTPITYMNPLDFNASLSNAAYGRGTEVRPNSVTGIWIIRASGTFTAQNTNFNVLTGDSTAPVNGVLVKGGVIGSQYQVAGQTRAYADFKAQHTWGNTYGAAIIGAGLVGTDGTTTSYQFEFRSNGDFLSPKGIYGSPIRADMPRTVIRNTVGGSVQSRIVNQSDNSERSAFGLYTSVGDTTAELRYGNLTLTSDASLSKTWLFDMSGTFKSPGPVTATGPFNAVTTGGTVALATGIYPTYVEIVVSGVPGLSDGSARAITHSASDARKKTKVKTIPEGQAMAEMEKVRPVSFAFKANSLTESHEELPRSYGLIAQELEEIIPDAVITLRDGMKELDPAITTGFLFAVVKDLVSEVKSLKGTISDLTKQK